MWMRGSWRVEIPQLALIAAMFALAAVLWSSMPERMPVHWGFTGEPDRYGGRFEGLLVMPLLAAGLYLLLLFLPRIDPRRPGYESFRGPYLVVRVSVLATIAAVYGLTLLQVRGRSSAFRPGSRYYSGHSSS